jgi:hypothetical protein
MRGKGESYASIQIGACSVKANLDKMFAMVKFAGFTDAYIKTE